MGLSGYRGRVRVRVRPLLPAAEVMEIRPRSKIAWRAMAVKPSWSSTSAYYSPTERLATSTPSGSMRQRTGARARCSAGAAPQVVTLHVDEPRRLDLAQHHAADTDYSTTTRRLPRTADAAASLQRTVAGSDTQVWRRGPSSGLRGAKRPTRGRRRSARLRALFPCRGGSAGPPHDAARGLARWARLARPSAAWSVGRSPARRRRRPAHWCGEPLGGARSRTQVLAWTTTAADASGRNAGCGSLPLRRRPRSWRAWRSPRPPSCEPSGGPDRTRASLGRCHLLRTK